MKFLISGGSGLVGSSLEAALRTEGHDVYRLVRRAVGSENEIRWHPGKGEIDPASLEGFDVVVNLAGDSIAGGKWTNKKMDSIRQSRVKSTTLLANTLAEAK